MTDLTDHDRRTAVLADLAARISRSTLAEAGQVDVRLCPGCGRRIATGGTELREQLAEVTAERDALRPALDMLALAKQQWGACERELAEVTVQRDALVEAGDAVAVMLRLLRKYYGWEFSGALHKLELAIAEGRRVDGTESPAPTP